MKQILLFVTVVIGVANTTHNTTKSKEQIQAAINDEIEERTSTLRWLTKMAGKLLPLTIFILLFSCMFYLKSYLKNIEHDNKYITPKFTEIDDTLGASFGKSEKLMPLNSNEKERYYNKEQSNSKYLKLECFFIVLRLVVRAPHMPNLSHQNICFA